jgi:drug/metabolite transporter (DMT)-like permease
MPPKTQVDAEAAQRLRGIGLYCLTMLAFACLDTCAKYAGRHVPSMEVAWIRFVGHLVLALVLLQPWRNVAAYRTRRFGAQVLRSLFLAGSTVFNFLALRSLQLDQTVSITFSGPFLIAILAGPLLGEWAGARRWVAILIGFAGVLVITLPGFGGFKPAILLSIGSMLSYVSYILSTRLLVATETSTSMLLFSAAVPSLFLAPAALPVAVPPPTLLVAFCMFMTGLLGLVGHWFVIVAHRHAPAPVLAPFSYTQILWMITLGYLVFGDVPEPRTLVGTAIIVGSGLYLLYRERRR